MSLFAFFALFARVGLIIPGMILLLLPTMAKSASILVDAAIRIRSDEIFDFPIWAKFLPIFVNVRFSPQVLPIVSVDAALLVVILAPGTPNCFEVKNVEIGVFGFHGVQQVNSDFVF